MQDISDPYIYPLASLYSRIEHYRSNDRVYVEGEPGAKESEHQQGVERIERITEEISHERSYDQHTHK